MEVLTAKGLFRDEIGNLPKLRLREPLFYHRCRKSRRLTEAVVAESRPNRSVTDPMSHSLRSRQRRSAEGTAPGGDGNFAQTFRALLCGRIGRRLAAASALVICVQRRHHRKIYC